VALYDDPNKITSVLLSDGWHYVYDKSFAVDAAVPPTEFSFITYLADSTDPVTHLPTRERIKIWGPLTSVYALKSDKRLIGQQRRRRVQPVGAIEVMMNDGIWYPAPEVEEI